MGDAGKSTIAAYNCPNCGASVTPESPSCIYCRSAIAARVCPSCFGAVAVGMMHCPHCGAAAGQSVAEQAEALRCPRCEAELVSAGVGRHSLSVCSQCGGLWVDKDAFQDICARVEEQEAVLNFRSEAQEGAAVQGRKPRRVYIPCPKCGKLMNQKNFSGCSGVVLDWCRDHGSWFDKDELRKIVAFIRDGGLRKAREREQADLQEKESRLRMQEFQLAALGRRLDTDLGSPSFEQGTDPFLQILFQIKG